MNDGVVPCLNKKDTAMKLTTIALATAFALTSTLALAQTYGGGSVVAPSVGSSVAPSVGSSVISTPTWSTPGTTGAVPGPRVGNASGNTLAPMRNPSGSTLAPTGAGSGLRR